ncbi:NAD-dependent epimerase/dehydratase family protein [Nocardioides sp.]|uniref:NAD-dependent epimerase/dehydratase family protein n=1 Tax=Nocardioides sp. TaxID=35761 RepID=UPI003511E0E4
MKILLTGGTGFIGRAVLGRLIEEGHEVTAVVRSESSATKVAQTGATALVGDLFDAGWLIDQLRGHDAAIHTAAGSDGRDAELNDAVIEAALTAFAGTEKVFVHTGGVWVYGSNDAITEESPLSPPAITSWRPAGEQRVLDSGLRAAVVQPGIVYGHGQGIPAMLAGSVDGDTVTVPGTGDQHWTTIHVDDLADLYLAVLAAAPAGRAYLGVNGQNPTARELGEALAATVRAEGDSATVARLGAFGEALVLDQQAAGERARNELGWAPTRPSLLEELRAGYTA